MQRGLEADHVGAEFREQPADLGDGGADTEVDHAQAGERRTGARIARSSRGAVLVACLGPGVEGCVEHLARGRRIGPARWHSAPDRTRILPA